MWISGAGHGAIVTGITPYGPQRPSPHAEGNKSAGVFGSSGSSLHTKTTSTWSDIEPTADTTETVSKGATREKIPRVSVVPFASRGYQGGVHA